MAFTIRYNDAPISHALHTHTYYELLYVLEGEAVMTIHQQDYSCPAGALVFLNPFDAHASRPVTLPYRRYYLLIPQTQLKAFHNDVLLLSVFRFHGQQFPYVLRTGELKARFDTYFSLLESVQREGGNYADTRMEALMTLILTDAQAIRPDMFLPADTLSFLPIQDILSELDDHFCEPFSLEKLAESYHVSPGCLSAHFRRSEGVSPMQYVTQSRLSRAKLLLQHSELPVGAVAEACGYPDTSNFVRRFHSQFGETPLQFRQRHPEESRG